MSTSLIVRGILAVIVGIIALAWPSVTVLALVILFAVYAFMAAGLQAARAFSSRQAGPVFGHLLLGLVDLAAGVIALAWPGPTALVLVLIVGVWAIVAGMAEIAAAFGHGEAAGTRALFSLGGLITVAFGVVLCARPGIGAVTWATRPCRRPGSSARTYPAKEREVLNMNSAVYHASFYPCAVDNACRGARAVGGSASANGGGVAFFAHVGGFVFGLVVTWLLVRAGQVAPQEPERSIA